MLSQCCNGSISKERIPNNKDARILFSPSWETTKLFIKNNRVDQIIVSSSISEFLLKELSELCKSQTNFIILGSRDSVEQVIKGTSGYFFKKTTPYQLMERRI